MRTGDLIFWSIEDFKTTKDELIRLGFEHLVPRNDFRTAMIRAMRTVLKVGDDSRFYRRFGDKDSQVYFAVVNPVETGSDIEFKREIVICLDKIHGNYDIIAGTPSQAFKESLQREYTDAKETVDSIQFRNVIVRTVREECYGISMRKGGGVYFIDKKFDELRIKLQKLFEAFPNNAKLFSVPVYDDAGTKAAVEHAATEDIFGDIDSLVGEIQTKFKDNSMTPKTLQSKAGEAERILTKIAVHEDNLRSQADEVRRRLTEVTSALKDVRIKVEAKAFEPDDFFKALSKMKMKKQMAK